MTPASTPKALWAILGCVAILALAGCPSTAAECAEGLTRCGDACIDSQSDKANCGACGIACGALQVCTEGTCGCREGTVDCNGTCVTVESDGDNCGACGNACGAGEVCENSSCSGSGSGYALAGICGGNAKLVGLSDAGNAGPLMDPGVTVSGLQAIGHYEGNPIVSTYGSELLQFNGELAPVGEPLTTGASPMEIHADPPFMYAVTSLDNTLNIFEAQGGNGEEGFNFVSVGALNFGPGTSPQAIARIGDTLYVPLYGDLSRPEADDPGQRIAVVDISDPTAPVVTSTIDLSGLDLQAFPDATPRATPQGVLVRGDHLYVPLNSMQPSFSPGGPGLLAKVNPTTGEATTVALDPEACENVYDVKSVGDMLVVSCAGVSVYDASWQVVSVDKTAVVLLDAEDAHVATYPFVCTATDCPIAKAGRMAVKDGQVFVSDEAGRLIILGVGPEGFTEIRGFSAVTEQGPLQVCSGGDYNNLADLVALP